MAKFTAENARQMGAKGGQRTAELHGQQHMRAIGLRGFWATVLRHWDGDSRAYVNYLIALGLADTDPVPQNRAFEHDRTRLKWRARYGMLGHLRRSWQPPEFPDDMEPPF